MDRTIKIPKEIIKKYQVRRPFEDIDGYMESDNDYVYNNIDVCIWFLEQLEVTPED